MIKLRRTLLGIILFLVIWQVLAIYLDANTIIPGLGAIYNELTSLIGKQTFLVAVVSTIGKVIVALLLTLLIGLPLGFLLGINNKLFDMFRPIIMVIQAVPVISWLTLVIFAWGIGFRGPIFITFLSLFPIALLTTVSGVRNLDKNLLEMATLYQVPRWLVIKYIYLGSLLPFIVAILDVTLGQAWKVILVSEYLCGNSGLGVLILAARYEVNPAKVWALTFFAVLLGLIAERLVKLLLRKVAKRWAI
ncbi:MAG TPA: ABC transporter permease subunit [Syntrophomonadaceae bacterium]|nr:ABC transporter permease subunit [Syntrophomonadaceae bacterium]HQD91579.1 ABC transporter permease subunit [Syntrophomonadaceae bacterium]